MPNWCNNTITIQGSTETVKTLWETATAVDGDNTEYGLLNAMVPMPEALRDTTSPDPQPGQANYKGPQPKVDGFTNWYDWCVANWGVKWDVSTEGLEFTDNGDGTAKITGWFDSPWGPPLEAVSKFSEDMDGVHIELFYEESGMCFVGCWDSEGGDDYYEYAGCDSNTIKDTVPEYLVDHFAIDERMSEWEQEEAEYEKEADNA